MKILIENEQLNNHDSLVKSHLNKLNYDKVIIGVKPYFSVLFDLVKLQNINLISLTTNQRFSFGLLILCLVYRKRVRLTLHNINAWCLKESNRGKYLVRYYYRRLLLYLTSEPYVNSMNQKNYLSNICPEMVCEAISFSDELSFTGNWENTIVYPGSYNTSRRCYENFLKNAELHPKYSWIILGKHKKDRSRYPPNVVTFSEFVKPSDFDNIIRKAKFLWTELVVIYTGNGSTEIYGRSKDSGISYLQQQYGIPLIINNEFNNLEHLNIGTFSIDCCKKLLYLDDDRYAVLRNNLRTAILAKLCI